MATIEQIMHRKEMQRRKDIEICSDYKALKAEYPNAGEYVIFDTLADKYRKGEMKLKGITFPTTGMGVRDVIIRHGLYKPRRSRKNA